MRLPGALSTIPVRVPLPRTTVENPVPRPLCSALLALTLLGSTACKDGASETALEAAKLPVPAASPSAAKLPAAADPEVPPALPSPSTEQPAPVLVIGADALDLAVLMPLVKAGKMPNFAALLEEGAHGTLLSENEMRSPALWTTMATGRPRAVHGIYDFVTGSRLWPEGQRGGEKRLVTSKMRKVPALWTWMSAVKRPVAVVGWLNTWPAEDVTGVMVSPYVAIGRAKQITIKGNVYPDEPYQVSPESRWKEILELITVPDDVPAELVASFAEEPDAELLRDYPLLERYMDGLRWSLAHSLTMKAITLQLIKKDNPQLVMAYFEGADSLAHRFWLFRQARKAVRAQLREGGMPASGADELRRRYGKVVDRYYVFFDAIVGELIEALPAGSRVLVISDHGFTDRSGRYPVQASVPFTGEHRIEGTVIAAGPGVAAGKKIFGATLYDVVPTIVDWLDLDVKVRFEGRSLVPGLTEDDSEDPAAAPEAVEEPDESFREQELERLRSLGYIQ